MKSRPWPLVLLAVIQILTPVLTVIFNATALRVPPWRVIAWIFERGPIGIFETLCLMPIAGIAIYAMKRWSYPVFLVAVGWSAVRNLSQWNYASTLLPSPALLFVYISEAAFVGYFLLPAVRATYFDPNVRWWEHKPRYLLELAASLVMGSARTTGLILNLSEGGAFVSSPEKLEKDSVLRLEFTVISLAFAVEGKIVHVRALDTGGFCYGVQFQHTPETQASFRNLASALDTLGFNERDGRGSPLQEFRHWAGTLLRTGRGLVPDVRLKRRN